MSDFNNPDKFDKYGNPLPGNVDPGIIPGIIPGSVPGTVYEPVGSTGRGPYILLGLLVLVGIVGGALYFHGSPNSARRDVAAAPPTISDTVRTPSSPALPATRPMDATPAPSAMPAPADAPAKQ